MRLCLPAATVTGRPGQLAVSMPLKLFQLGFQLIQGHQHRFLSQAGMRRIRIFSLINKIVNQGKVVILNYIQHSS